MIQPSGNAASSNAASSNAAQNDTPNNNAPQNDAPMPKRLEIGDVAPRFSLPGIAPDGGEITIDLDTALSQGKRIVLYFYPAAMTPGCTTEACDFRDNLARLTAYGYQVIGVSKDPLDKLRRFAERDQLTFPLLSDPDFTVHRAYAAWGERKLYGKTHVGAIRSTMVIDPDGRIVLARYNVRAKGHVASLMKALGIAQ